MAESNLESLYAEAQQALKAKDYQHAASLLKQILVIDDDYKDASRLLARVVKEKRRRWYNDMRIWGPVMGMAMIGLLIWLAPKVQLPALFAPTSTATASPTATAIPTKAAKPTITPSPTPTSIPLAWKRISMGQEFERDTITVIVIDPTDPDVSYVGTDNAGIYKSIVGGMSWQPIHYGLGRASIGSLVLDPQDVKVLYAGTSSGGVYKTTDGGEHWQETNQGLLYERQYAMINVLAMTQQDVRHLYHTDGNNLFETENGGESWQKIEAPICPNTGGSIILAGLVVHPTHPQTLFALDHKCTGGVYQSTDGGKTWTPTSAPRKFGGNWLGIDRSAGDNLYFNSNEGLYGSTDGGDSWRWLLQSDCPAFAIHPDIPAVAICGTRERSVIKTADGGKTWQTVAQLALAEITAITFSPKTPSTIYVGGQGVYASTDEGRTWTARSSGLGGVRLELKLDPTGRSLLYAQESLCGYYASPRLSRSLDEGRTWETVTKEGCGLEFDADGTTLYRLAWDEILRSQDEGKTWTKITTPFAERIGGLTAHPHQPRTLYALSLYQAPYIFVSGDGGDTWQSTTGIQGGAERIFFGNEQTPVAYATDTTTIHRSTDGGSTWTRCSQTYVGYAQSDSRLVIDPRDGNRVILATRSAGILISKSGCIGWQPSNTGLGSLFVNTVAIDPNNPGTLYVGTDGGAYVSFDGGEHWGQVNDGLLGALVVYSIVLDKDSNVYAATPYGIFKLEGK